MSWKAPGCPLILTTHFLLPPFSLTSFNLSATSFLQSSLSSFGKSRLMITLLKLSLSFNLLLLSRTTFLVSKLSNFINEGLGFEDSSNFLPILNISTISFSIVSYLFSCYFFQELWHEFFFFWLSNIFCQIVDCDVVLPSLSLIVHFYFWVCVCHWSLDIGSWHQRTYQLSW